MVWPGLTSPVMRGRELVQQQQLPEDPERQSKLIKMRDEMGAFRPLRLLPTERGWSGTKMPGRSIGPPDAVGEGELFLILICSRAVYEVKLKLSFLAN